MADYSTAPRPGPGPDPVNVSVVSPSEDARTVLINQIAWGAVFAGAAVALFVQLLLNLLAVGVGLASVSPVEPGNPSPETFSIAAGIWYVISTIIAAYVGGYVAGRVSGKPVDNTAGYHGLTSWAVGTLFFIFLLTSAVGGIIGGAASTLGSVGSGIGATATTAAQTAAPALANGANPLGDIEAEIRGATGGTDPAALRDAAVSAVKATLTGNEAEANAAREKAAQAIATSQNISIDEARTRVADYERTYRERTEQAKQQALEAAEAARKIASTAALFAFFAFLLGAVAAWFGGRSGTVTPTVSSARIA